MSRFTQWMTSVEDGLLRPYFHLPERSDKKHKKEKKQRKEEHHSGGVGVYRVIVLQSAKAIHTMTGKKRGDEKGDWRPRR